MKGRSRLAVVLLAAIAQVAGCASDPSTTGGGAGDTGSSGASNDAAVAPDVSPEPTGQPLACDEETSCAEGLACRSGVCLADPVDSEVAILTDPTGLAPHPADTAPNLGCVGDLIAASDVTAASDEPETATVYGAVTRFGSGLVTTNVMVEVCLAEAWDPTSCESVEGDDQGPFLLRGIGLWNIEGVAHVLFGFLEVIASRLDPAFFQGRFFCRIL